MAKKKAQPEPVQELEVTEDQIALQAIAEVNQELDQARIDEQKKKEAYTTAKARVKELEADREQVLHDFTTTLPLFDKPRAVARALHPETVEAPPPAEAAAEATPEPAAEPVTAGPADDDESWRGLSLIEFRLPEALLDLLNGRDLFTVGQYSEWCKAPGNSLDQIKGLGPAKLTKIADAEIAFWERWRAGEYLPPTPAAEAVDPDAVIGDALSAEAAAEAPGDPAEDVAADATDAEPEVDPHDDPDLAADESWADPEPDDDEDQDAA